MAELPRSESYAHAVAATENSEDFEVGYDPADALKELAGRHSSIFEAAHKRPPVTLEYTDLTFSVGDRKILDNVNGHASPGQVLAIMGPSGAGKTTLLDMLAGRLTPSKNNATSGSVLLNGRKRDFNTFRQISAMVLQADNFFADLSVKETVTLYALLRLPRHMPEADKHMRVTEVLTELGLTKCEDTLVGNELKRGISGGERKRLNIACELVTDPSLLFLDEPTTGLDSFAAQSIMQTLLTLAQAGRTVLTTIHQPRSSIYQIFDRLQLLSEGRIIYFGPASDALAYFAKRGYVCPDDFNPADFFIDFLSIDYRTPGLERSSRRRVAELADDFARQPAAKLEIKAAEDAAPLALEPKYATTWLTQFTLLTRRSFKGLLREKATLGAMFGQSVVFAVLLGLIWLYQGNNLTSLSVQSIAGVIFFLLVNQSFSGTFGIIFLFPAERLVVMKERSSRLYHVGAYFWAKSVSELPRPLLFAMLFSIITYFMISLRAGAGHFFAYYIIIVMTQLAAEGVAYCVSAISANPQQAGALAPVFIVTSMLFCGYLIEISAIPVWLRWINYLSFIKYGFALAMQNEFQDRTLSITCDQAGSFCPQTGQDVLDFYGLNDLPFYGNFLVLLGLILFMRTLAYVILVLRGPKFDHTI